MWKIGVTIVSCIITIQMLKSLFRSIIERVGAGGGGGGGNTAVVLGRWGIQYDPRVIDCKVFQANEDHCGCCVVPKNEAAMTKSAHLEETHTQTKARVVISEEESYLVPYLM